MVSGHALRRRAILYFNTRGLGAKVSRLKSALRSLSVLNATPTLMSLPDTAQLACGGSLIAGVK